MEGSILDAKQDIGYLDSLFDENRLLKVMPESFYKNVPNEHLALFGHFNGFYCFPTLELAEWIKGFVDLSKAIEIGAGHGALGRYLGIPITDSKCMERPDVKAYYDMIRQPVTRYPADIIKMDAVEAIEKYKPETVIGCWITHKYCDGELDRGGNIYGIDEDFIIENVKRYIVVGNERVHKYKRILGYEHKEFKFPWLYSRSLFRGYNVIYMWER